MIKAIIFDLDGTLLDTKQDLANSINLTLKSLHKGLMSQEEIITHVGNGIARLVNECINPKNNIEADKAIELFQSFYSKEFLKTTYPYNGMVELVHNLKN